MSTRMESNDMVAASLQKMYLPPACLFDPNASKSHLTGQFGSVWAAWAGKRVGVHPVPGLRLENHSALLRSPPLRKNQYSSSKHVTSKKRRGPFTSSLLQEFFLGLHPSPSRLKQCFPSQRRPAGQIFFAHNYCLLHHRPSQRTQPHQSFCQTICQRTGPD